MNQQKTRKKTCKHKNRDRLATQMMNEYNVYVDWCCDCGARRCSDTKIWTFPEMAK